MVIHRGRAAHQHPHQMNAATPDTGWKQTESRADEEDADTEGTCEQIRCDDQQGENTHRE
ncbi:hypothetical protein [Haladaptatus sp. NG-SE-30]